MQIGVFDSGIGGEAIAATLRAAFPDATVRCINDCANLPYGDKDQSTIITLTDRALQPLLAQHCNVIVIACNTATAAAIDTLRIRYPEQKFIGLEPMVRTAASLTKRNTFAICATPSTLASQRYQLLKQKFASGIQVIEPDCSTWASMIEHNTLNQQLVTASIENVCDQGADVIVLACTHYHWIRGVIERAAQGRATIIDPSAAIVRRVRELSV